MAIRNLGQIVADLVSFIKGQIPTLSMLEGSVARDVVTEAPAQEFVRNNDEAQRLRDLQALDNPDQFTEEELDKLASDNGLTRLVGVAATGLITFRLPSFSTSDPDITIPIGTQVATSATIQTPTIITFRTTATGQFVAANAETFLNPLTGLFEVQVPIEAEEVGTTGNVATQTINTLISEIGNAPNITVRNELSLSGGTEAETNENLAERLRIKLAGNNVGTTNGILSLVNADTNVLDSLLVRPGDPELLRNQFGNSADVVIIGDVLEEVNEERVFDGTLGIQLNRQPVDAVSSITGFSGGGTPTTFVLTTDYTVDLDLDGLFNGTTRATSKITFTGATLPDVGSVVTITYTFNSLIEDLQATLDSDDNKIVGSDILMKEATLVLIKVSAIISKIIPGFVRADVVADATTNVSDLLNSINLDSDVDRSDIIATIANTEGVDAVDVDSLVLEVKRPIDPGFITVVDIVIARTEFGRPDTITIT